MYDSHCHLDFPELSGSLEATLEVARSQGIESWHVPGCGPSQWPQLTPLVGVSGVSLGVGIHPWWVAEVLPGPSSAGSGGQRSLASAVDDAMRRLAVELHARHAVALGECGLDRPRARSGGGPSLAQQRSVFEAQLVLARELRLPLVLHVVGEHGATLELLDRVGELPAGGVVHGYSGSAELVPRYVAKGFMIGLGTRVTGAGARRAREALQRVPLDWLLLETDAPDQAPAVGERFDPARRGVPADLVVVAREAAQQRGVSTDTLGRITAANARRLFG